MKGYCGLGFDKPRLTSSGNTSSQKFSDLSYGHTGLQGLFLDRS